MSEQANIFERLGVARGLFLAPMEDVTDIPFRLMAKRYGADMMYTEFVNADGLVRSKKPTKTREKLKLHPDEHPIGIQIYGGNLDTMRQAAEIAEQAEPEILDINAGCWVRNVAMRGAGAGLLRDLPAMVMMARTIVDQVNLPVTLKTRLGWDRASIQIVELARMLEDAGIAALTVHCRTRDQAHDGEADWSWIPKIKSAVSIPVVLNGDVNSPDAARRAFDETGCDAVMIGRAAIANPWIFQEIKTFFSSGVVPDPPQMRERVETAIEHARLGVEFKGERRAVIEMRKHYAGYLRGLPNNRALRIALMKPETLGELEDMLHSFLYYEELAAQVA